MNYSFNVGDNVVYGGNGVCKIARIEEMSFFNAMPEEYYVLEPVFGGQSSTMFVPSSNEIMMAKMKPVISREEAEEILLHMKDNPMEWPEEKNVRKETFSKILLSGDRKSILSLIVTITQYQMARESEGKRLNLQDEKFLEDAKKIMKTEVAVAFGIDISEVDQLLQKYWTE